MQSRHSFRRSLGRREDGVALIVTLMVLMLISVLMVGFVAAIIADTRASGLDRDQTQAYAAAHAGLEQITSDLSSLFVTDFSPSGSQIAALRANPPVLTGFSFIAPGGAAGSGYWVAPRFPDGSGNPLPEDPINGSTITAGPYQGFRGIITPYDITVTARSRGGAEVRMRRTLQTVAIPVFQFGMFSETDLAFHAGAEAFTFGGRVHTNGNLFLAAADAGSLTIADRITAVKEIIRTHLPNGLVVTDGYEGAIRIPTTIASNPTNNVYRNLARTEGSIQGTVPPIQSPQASPNPNWTKLSQGTYLNNIRTWLTGAKRLDLPLVADLDNNGVPDAQPIELIRRPATGSNENVANPLVFQQRYFSQASLRIMLSDDSTDLTGLPTVVGTAPVQLNSGTSYTTAGTAALRAPLATAAAPGSASGALAANVYKSAAGSPLIGGWIKIEIQRADGTWTDVTNEILGLGIAGRNLARKTGSTLANNWNTAAAGASETCPEPHPNAIIRLQRVRDVPLASTSTYNEGQRCGVVLSSGTVTSVSASSNDYWPNTLYDTREGQFRDDLSGSTIYLGGIMHYIELDVNNLRRWLAGDSAMTAAGAANGPNAKNDNGYIVYFSDRRLNNDGAGRETGEYGFEDVTNPTTTGGSPNGIPNVGEDLNDNGGLDIYGQQPYSPMLPGGALTPFDVNARPWTAVPATVNDALVARANRHVLFRRALKLVNGHVRSSSTDPGTCTPTPCNSVPNGLTIVSENPVYVQGNYNATSTSVTGTTNVPAAVIADAVTLLSNNWNDIRSFVNPSDSTLRPATATGYRMAIITGKGLAFPQPSGTDASFGSDGGAHNFMRSLENWDTTGTLHRYRGSLVSFFINRQGTGTFKCCGQDAYNRGDREWSFDTDFLLPSKLPPGTPMFRDVNTLTFRQLLRPTQ